MRGGEDGGEIGGILFFLGQLPCCPEQNRLLQAPETPLPVWGLVALIADIPGELCGVGTELLSQRFLCLYFPVAVETRSLHDG